MTDGTAATRGPGRLQGKGVIVTGGARGVGAAIAEHAVAEGARVLVLDTLERHGVETVERLGEAASFVRADVADERDWGRVIASAKNHLEKIDGLVNNAAALWMGRLEDMSVDEARHVLEVNVIGTFLGMRAVVGPMRDGGGGSIVNISSVDGLGGMNSVAMYSASKWAGRGLAKSAAFEFGRDGIRVNTVCPLTGNRELISPWLDQFDPERYQSHVQQPALLDDGARRTSTVDDIAPMVTFLLSDESRACSGADFTVDEAWTAGKHCPGLPGF